MAAIGRPSTAAGVASLYAGLIDAMVVDEDDPDPPPAEIPTHAAPTLMDGAAGRARLARIVLDYAASLTKVEGHRVLPVKRFDEAKRRLAAGIDDDAAPRPWSRRCSPTCSRRSAKRARSSGRSSSAASPAPPSSAAEAGAERDPRPARRRPLRGGARRDRRAPSRAAPSASSSSPATALCSTRASSTGC